MKRKLISWMMILIMAVSLAACGSSEKADETEENEGVEVDEDLLTVEITMPAEYMEETTQEELDESVKESGFLSATLNEDGSATYVMTKRKHKEFMKETKEEFQEGLDEMIGSEEYPNFTEIKVNDDYTTFTVTTKSTELDFNESFSVLAFYLYGDMYNQFNGTPVDNIHVDFVNADSGEIISSADSKDLGEETE